ncbi:SRPBCC family protein [Ulvibacterium marinum]|uniref:SRPBCC family protein n=1 Tax=Ulvibacterium marinum TaxID=2419782 RepID=UPI002494754A|nr:SRPBCC family protein [Ulvibacterium marinum]
MVDVTTEIVIQVPVEEVSVYASNPENAAEWYTNIKSVEWKTPKPLAQGSKIAFKAQFLGRQLAYIYEVTEFVPRQKMVMKTSEGPFPMETTYSWEEIGPDTTKMTLRNKGIPSGFSKLFTPIMVAAVRRANKADLKRIKTLLEE